MQLCIHVHRYNYWQNGPLTLSSGHVLKFIGTVVSYIQVHQSTQVRLSIHKDVLTSVDIIISNPQ